MATPSRPSAAERRRPTLWDGLVILAVLALAAVWALAARPSTGGQSSVTILRGTETVYTCDLSRLTEPVEVRVEGPYPLTVTLSPDGAEVTEYTCPDGDCAAGRLRTGKAGQLICLPNRTIIRLECGTLPFFDAVTG